MTDTFERLWQDLLALAEVERLKSERDEARVLVERLKSERDEARVLAERLRAERRQLRARLVECRPWVGVCPIEPANIHEVCLVRDLADDTLEEVKP